MNSKKVAGVLILILVIFFVVAQPGDAAGVVHDIIDFLKHSATQVVAFLKGVLHG